MPFERGPEEIADLPAFFGKRGAAADLSRHDMRIFAEIVDASMHERRRDSSRARPRCRTRAPTSSISAACPTRRFPHLEETIAALKARGLSRQRRFGATPTNCERGARAGADYLLSLDEHTLAILPDHSPLVPILVPDPHGDLDSLQRAARIAESARLAYILDPILDPIHFGFAASHRALCRDARARAARPRS